MSLDGDRLAIRNPDSSYTAADIRQTPPSGTSDTHTLYVQNKASSGLGQALVIESANASVPAFTVTAPTGGTAQRWNGALVVAAVAGAPDVSTLPLGGTSKARNTGLQLVGSFAGGEDDSSGTDSTPRINIYSYQRASTNSFGEIMRNWLMRKDSKAMVAWYGPQLTGTQTHGYDGSRNALTSGVSWKPWAWMGAHYEANDHNSTHGHWSMEVPDSTGALQTRFEILFADRTTGAIGLDKTFIITNDADFVVRQSGGETLRVVAPAGTEKRIEFMSDAFGDSATRRWKIRANSTAESGANVGTDFQIVRYDDTGTSVDSPIEITRSTGQVKLGVTGGVLITRASGIALQVTPTATGGQALNVIGNDATTRAYQGQVTGDSTNRHIIYVDGKQEWGDGSTRDTNLYRSAANTLKTDDLFNAVGVTSTTAGTIAAGTFATSADGTASLGTVVINPFSTSKRALDIRLSADGSSRLRFDFSAATGNGTISFGDGTNTDVNLYRSAANVLKTDDSFSVGINLAVTGTTAFSGAATSTGAAAGSTAYASLVTSDTFDRFRILADGGMEWGSGAGARDVTLYRSAANVLKTDDKLITAIGLGVGNSAAATTLGTVTKKMEVFDASGSSLGFVPIYDAIT